MHDTIDGMISKLRQKLQQEPEVISKSGSGLITPEITADVLQKLHNSWDNIEEDKKILYRFIDEWVDTHKSDES